MVGGELQLWSNCFLNFHIPPPRLHESEVRSLALTSPFYCEKLMGEIFPSWPNMRGDRQSGLLHYSLLHRRASGQTGSSGMD